MGEKKEKVQERIISISEGKLIRSKDKRKQEREQEGEQEGEEQEQEQQTQLQPKEEEQKEEEQRRPKAQEQEQEQGKMAKPWSLSRKCCGTFTHGDRAVYSGIWTSSRGRGVGILSVEGFLLMQRQILQLDTSFFSSFKKDDVKGRELLKELLGLVLFQNNESSTPHVGRVTIQV